MRWEGGVDLQVNGYQGVDFSSPMLTVDDVIDVADELAQQGTAAFCPTVTTSPLAAYEHVLPVLAQAAADQRARGRLLGIHLEGPFINPTPGAVGVHPAQHVCKPDVDLFERLWDLSKGTIAILTLAPEMPGAMPLIERARTRGVAVSLGHTLCGADEVREAVACGATLSTHLGNGCPALLDRHNNPIWAQLDSPLIAMVIADGEHLPGPILRSIVRLKGKEQLILTSDLSPVAGLTPGIYQAFGHDVRITPNGRIENCAASNLAGSSSTLTDCIDHLAANGFSQPEFLRKVGFLNPLAAINKNAGDVQEISPRGKEAGVSVQGAETQSKQV